MSELVARLRSRLPRWIELELRTSALRRVRLIMPLEPFETPLAFVVHLGRWWLLRRRGEPGGWRELFAPQSLGLGDLRPDEPLLEVGNQENHVVLRIGGLS